MSIFDYKRYLDNSEITNGWQPACISIHDHSLSAEEASKHWMTYYSFSGSNDPRWHEFDQAENNFINLFRTLKERYQLEIVDCFQGSDNSSRSIDEIVSQNVREANFNVFYSRPLSLTILGNFDLTFPIFLPCNSTLSEVRTIVKTHGLHVY